MESFDEIGAAIYSLSIGESRGSVQPEIIEIHDDSDDLMDIDSLEGSLREDNAYQTDVTSKDDRDTAQVEEDGNSSFLETLNPTELGARYALMPRKLLKATPHSPSDTEHDYEFDTSDGNTTSGDSQTKSIWQTKSLWNRGTDFQDHHQWNTLTNGATGGLGPANYNPPQLENPIYGGFPGSSSLQIHHHHYYTNNQNQNNPPGHQPLQQLSHRSMGTATPISNRDQISQRKERSQRGVVREVVFRSMLPSPWDSEATPAEKTPYVLSSYLQLLINLFLSVYALHMMVSMIQAIRADVSHKMEVEANNVLVEIASCERSYRENNCSPDLIVPALEKMCAHWAKCMNQDPFKGGNRSSISAQTIGILLNSLIEPLSFKFLSVSTFLLIVVFACNFGFGYIRAKAYYGWSDR